MLTGRPTKYGSGIEIFGDYYDLKSLYNTVHALAVDENAPGNEVFFGFAYDIRKANENRDEEDSFDFPDKLIKYKSFKILWLYFIVAVKYMRENAGLMETTPDVQADLYRLESILENCLKSYDQKIGTEIFEWLKVHEIPKTEYMDLLIMDLTFKNLQAKDGKPRFKNLRKVIEMLLPKNPHHKFFKKFAESEAKRLKCHIGDMDMDLDFEGTGFRW